MSSLTPAPITVRRLRFEYPDGVDPVVYEGKPEESYLTVGLSLLLPYLEPYLIRSMRQARPLVKDATLLAEIDLFNGQEGQHYRQHIAFNEAVRVPGADKVRALEARVDADYHRFTKERSLRWNLAYAEGFEAYTSALARFSFDSGMLDRLHPQVRDLFSWHLIEELEHRTVAFDVYDKVCGGYFYRLFVGLYAQWHLNRFVMGAADAMAKGDPVAHRAKYGGALRAWRRLLPHMWRLFTQFGPSLLRTYLPWYSPHRIDMPETARALADHYTRLAAAKARDAEPAPQS